MGRIEELQQQIADEGKALRFICTDSHKGVVEGFPRSGNTYLVDALDLAVGRELFAHHTHSPKNLELGILQKVPAFCLVREPFDAIASYIIYSDLDVKIAAERYVQFYEHALTLGDSVTYLSFESIVNELPKVIHYILSLAGCAIVMEDLSGLDTMVRRKIAPRALKQHGEFADRRMAIPTPQREKMKADLSANVLRSLEGMPHVRRVYEEAKREVINLR